MTLGASGGDAPQYLDALYEAFTQNYLGVNRTILGSRLAFKRHPELEGRSATFWHLITSGDVEAERVPDMRRCERILWPAAIIDHADSPDVAAWKVDREGSPNILLAVEDFSYLVVLRPRPRDNYTLLWTAYTVEFENRRRRFEAEYERSEKC